MIEKKVPRLWQETVNDYAKYIVGTMIEMVPQDLKQYNVVAPFERIGPRTICHNSRQY